MRYGIIFSLVAALFAAGCGGEAGVPVHPVKGKVTIGGEAAEGIQITFQPVGEGEVAAGNSQADGTYTLFTGVQGRPGAAAGKYQVLLQDLPKSEAEAEAYMSSPTGGSESTTPEQAKGRIPEDYTPKEVEVKAGDNTIDIEI